MSTGERINPDLRIATLGCVNRALSPQLTKNINA